MAELTGYWQSNLSQMLDTLGEETVSGLLSSFSCPQNHNEIGLDGHEYYLQMIKYF